MNDAPPLPRSNSISAERILPTEALETLEALTHRGDLTRWGVGDLTLALLEELAGHHPKADIRAAVADGAGLTLATVRQYEGVAEAFDQDVRRQYAVLKYTHFRLVKAQADPLALLDWCVTSADNFGGKVAAPRVLAAHIEATRGKQPPAPDEAAEWRRDSQKYAKQAQRQAAPVAECLQTAARALDEAATRRDNQKGERA